MIIIRDGDISFFAFKLFEIERHDRIGAHYRKGRLDEEK